jgi:hypothetical protein
MELTGEDPVDVLGNDWQNDYPDLPDPNKLMMTIVKENKIKKGGEINMIKSSLKIGEEFNDCPGKVAIKREFTLSNLNKAIEFVDIEDPNWQNDVDTIILKIDKKDTIAALKLGQFAVDQRVNDFQIKMIKNGDLIVKFWWD